MSYHAPFLKSKRKFRCQYSQLECERRVFVPGQAKPMGFFADINCAVASLSKRKPRGWAKMIERMMRAAGKTAVKPAPEQGWTLDHPDRVVPHDGDGVSQSVDEYLKQLSEKRTKKTVAKKKVARRKQQQRRAEPYPTDATTTGGTAVVPVSGEARKSSNDYRIEIDDRDRSMTRKVMFMPPQRSWRTAVQEQLGISMAHAMPMFVSGDGRTLTLFPFSECDAMHLKASPVTVKVQMPNSDAFLSAQQEAPTTASTTVVTTELIK